MTEANHPNWYPSHLFHSGTTFAWLSVSVKAAGGTEEEEEQVPVTGTQHDTADEISRGAHTGTR